LGGTAGLYWEDGVSCFHPDPAPAPDDPEILATLLTEEAAETVENDENVEVVDERGDEDVDATEDDDVSDDGEDDVDEETTEESPDATVMDLRLAIFADAAVAAAVVVVVVEAVVDPPRVKVEDKEGAAEDP
jgi:hypothetical protein